MRIEIFFNFERGFDKNSRVFFRTLANLLVAFFSRMNEKPFTRKMNAPRAGIEETTARSVIRKCISQRILQVQKVIPHL